MNERLTELIKSTSAALASPSLAGASICTPTASSPISAEPPTHARHRLSKEVEGQTPREAVTAEMDALEGGRQTEPVMVATLEPGLAWMDMATVDGGIRRRQPGNPPAPAVAVAAGVAGGGAALLALPRFPGAISFPSD